jgi:hypothetical protein
MKDIIIISPGFAQRDSGKNSEGKDLFTCYEVSRIGAGTKVHLSYSFTNLRGFRSISSGRAICGSDSPSSRVRPSGEDFAKITCKDCLRRGRELGLIPEIKASQNEPQR